jgi:hypothetical protein
MATLIGIAVITVAAASRAEVQFVGYVISAESTKFALIETEKKTNAWLGIGGEFSDHRVVGFSPEKLQLVVETAGKRLLLSLIDHGMAERSAALEARDREFGRKVGDMIKEFSRPGIKTNRPRGGDFIDDVIAEAKKFGREIVHRDIKDGHEVIILDVPEERRQKRFVFNYGLSSSPIKKGDPIRTLILH